MSGADHADGKIRFSVRKTAAAVKYRRRRLFCPHRAGWRKPPRRSTPAPRRQVPPCLRQRSPPACRNARSTGEKTHFWVPESLPARSTILPLPRFRSLFLPPEELPQHHGSGDPRIEGFYARYHGDIKFGVRRGDCRGREPMPLVADDGGVVCLKFHIG